MEDLIAQAERHQDERREWQREAIEQNKIANERHSKRTSGIWIALMLRPIIELAILIVLIIKL